jgi:hypothetical protein
VARFQAGTRYISLLETAKTGSHPAVKGPRGGGDRVGTKLNTRLPVVLSLRTSVAVLSFSHVHRYSFTFDRKVRQRINIKLNAVLLLVIQIYN